jgi:hypothetical protein
MHEVATLRARPVKPFGLAGRLEPLQAASAASQRRVLEIVHSCTPRPTSTAPLQSWRPQFRASAVEREARRGDDDLTGARTYGNDRAMQLHPIMYLPDPYAERDFYELFGFRWPPRRPTSSSSPA